ncbi:hypothetical protein GCM10010329_52310 [Streptomyces spiroverticillatus]|uniref:Uncharacterized protein n=1 Tax=Streptomyces finlayi TaxID=67296 RepID=A0A918X209_9ACTN|nr:hypothetical protein [Streptomyces finlayi]GHA22506.1 hypothetical protein GCM10010329_52310 [Streptomyces spiroverticillatus]GHD04440.1 hypothetical protein GCM10010334_53250 [Streptomyces finlayi]
MAEIPGAREELERAAHWIRDRMREVAAEPAPGQELGLSLPSYPSIVDWHEPLSYQYTFHARPELPGGRYDPTVPARAAAWFAARGGWTVTQEQGEKEAPRPYIGTVRFHAVVGTKDGCELAVRTARGNGWITLWGTSPRIALYPPYVIVRPEPVVTPETLDPGYLLCYECDGLGHCPGCYGLGWVPDEERGRKRCPCCQFTPVCVICKGRGQLLPSLLSPYQRGYYRE